MQVQVCWDWICHEKTFFLLRKLLRLCDRVSPQVYDGKITSVTDFMLEVCECVLCVPLPAEVKDILP